MIFFLFIFVFYKDLFFQKISGLNVNSYADIANMRDVASTSYVQYVGNSNSIWNIIIYTIPRMFYFLFSPMPWQWRGGGDALVFFFDSCFYLIATFSTFKAILKKNHSKRKYIIGVFLALFFATFIFGWGVSNSGTAMRHRTKLVLGFAMLFGMAIDEKSK